MVEAVAIKHVLAWQLEQAMKNQQKTKQAMAKQLHTSRSQLDRLLDPRNVSVTLDTITRAARGLGKRVIIRVADAKAAKRAWALPATGRELFTRKSGGAAKRISQTKPKCFCLRGFCLVQLKYPRE